MGNKCENCIWYDLCEHDIPCPDYYNGADEDLAEILTEQGRHNDRVAYFAAWRKYVEDFE